MSWSRGSHLNAALGAMEHTLKSSEEHYKEGLLLVLAGYQLIEASLKTYLKNYFTIVRYILPTDLHFGFDGKDYETAALGTLLKVFSKVCGDSQLVADLKSESSRRDDIAHQAALVLFKKEHLLEEEFAALSEQLAVQGKNITQLIERLREAHNKMEKYYANIGT